MICDNCRTAGEYNWALKTAPVSLIDELTDRAKEHHKKCKGGTHCMCQHRVGGYLDPF